MELVNNQKMAAAAKKKAHTSKYIINQV